MTQQPTIQLPNPYLMMINAWADQWRLATELTSSLVRATTQEAQQVARAAAHAAPQHRPFVSDPSTHKMLIEVTCDEMTATKFFLATIAMAEAAEIYTQSIDSISPDVIPEALEELGFDEFEETDDDVPSVLVVTE